MQKAALQNRYLTALSTAGTRSRRNQEAYEEDSAAYDPQESFERSAEGAYAGFRDRLNEDIGSLREEQVGTGRLRTGWGTQDEDRLVTRSADRFSSMLADRALQTEQLRYSNLRDRGGYAERQGNTYLDLVSGGLDRAQAEENARRERRGNKARGIGTAIGAVGGSFIPGIGTKAGGTIGGALGGLFG